MPLTPIAIKEYRAHITQSGTNNPVATVIKNTLGETLNWTRDGLGQYSATITKGFTNENAWETTFGNLNTSITLIPISGATQGYYNVNRVGTNTIGINTVSDLAWTPVDLSTILGSTDLSIQINIQIYN